MDTLEKLNEVLQEYLQSLDVSEESRIQNTYLAEDLEILFLETFSKKPRIEEMIQDTDNPR